MSVGKKKELTRLTKEEFLLEQRLSDPTKRKKWRKLDKWVEQLRQELEHPEDD